MTDEQKAAFQAAVNQLGTEATVTYTPSPASVTETFTPQQS